jgi:polyisoprenoid-binding protein YceI
MAGLFSFSNFQIFKFSNSFLLFFVLSSGSFAQSYKPVDDGSSIKFRIKNFGFNVGGKFSGIQGAVKFDPANLPASSFDVSIDAASINTDIDARDNHLRKPEYFDVKNFPRIKFVSTKVTNSTKAGTLFVFGRLTIKNTTKDISFPFTADPKGSGYHFKGEFRLNRRDFGVGGDNTISDNLTVFLDINTVKI